MTNDELEKAKPEVEIELDGKTRHLKYDWWAVSLIEEEVGLGFLNPSVSGERLSLNKLIVVIWAGLLHEAPRLQGKSFADRQNAFRMIADWIFKGGKVEEATTKAMIALERAFPSKKVADDDAPEVVDGEAKNETPAAESPGLDTSPSPE